jgi:hypothetical protein
MSDNLQRICDEFPDEEFTIADGFNDAIIGVEHSAMRVVYSIEKSIEILMSQGMEEEDAKEHFYYNVEGSYMGKKTPVWIHSLQ